MSENKDLEQEEFTRITFEISKKLRNSFKSKVAAEGKTIKDVLLELVGEYVKENK